MYGMGARTGADWLNSDHVAALGTVLM